MITIYHGKSTRVVAPPQRLHWVVPCVSRHPLNIEKGRWSRGNRTNDPTVKVPGVWEVGATVAANSMNASFTGFAYPIKVYFGALG